MPPRRRSTFASASNGHGPFSFCMRMGSSLPADEGKGAFSTRTLGSVRPRQCTVVEDALRAVDVRHPDESPPPRHLCQKRTAEVSRRLSGRKTSRKRRVGVEVNAERDRHLRVKLDKNERVAWQRRTAWLVRFLFSFATGLQAAARAPQNAVCVCSGVPLRPLSTRVGVKAARPYTRPTAESISVKAASSGEVGCTSQCIYICQ